MEKMKLIKSRGHAIFECFDCGREWQDYKTARKQGYEHARQTGHRVRGEVGTAYHYN